MRLLFFILIALSFSGCCTKQELQSSGAMYTLEPRSHEPSALPLPAFLVKADSEPYNKIGTPEVIEKNGAPLVLVSSSSPSLYFEQDSFNTATNSYTNLLNRIHFSKVPFGICNLNITAGNNPGLLLIYTLDSSDRLVLITSVHTCGCYLAFFPTEDLPKEAYPPDWPQKTQHVYGYRLPSLLPSMDSPIKTPYYFTLESDTHRISWVSGTLGGGPNFPSAYPMAMKPMESLYHLPYKGKSISFFETAGRREGYVRNNSKIIERLLISWWAFDWHVGEDKAYGKSDSSKTPFYTSLKFWQRNSSDMKNFPEFLSYWGWNF